LLAIRLMRIGAKKSPFYRIVVKEKLSKREGAYLENVGTYNPTRNPAEVKIKMDRVQYWMERGAQPTDTVRQLIKKYPSSEGASETASPTPPPQAAEGQTDVSTAT
jgi:small subunit ribosomal protein S16